MGRFWSIALFFLLAFFGANTLAFAQEGGSTQSFRARAVSLKVLQERAKDCMTKGECPKNILQLCGLTKVTGFVVDGKNRDLIIVGEADTTSPPLFLEDFVVSLRNTWFKYAQLRGNTYYYSAPGCSIDPKQETLQKLQKLGGKIFSASGETGKIYQKWQAICGEPQDVVVLGIPFNTRFAKITVEADYYMKRLVNGSVSLAIKGFESLTDMTLNIAKEAIIHNRPISAPVMSLSRFWFFPGENRYVEDEGVVCIGKCQVKLLTEEEFLTKTGELAGTGKANILARKFSENFTGKYNHISQKKPIYTELEALFRFVALTKIMKFKGSLSEAELGINYLLNQYPIKSIHLASTLPGLSHVKRFEHRKDYAGGYQITKLQFPSCGGVAIDIRVRKKNFSKDKTGKLRKLRQAVLKSRPSRNALYWDLPTG